MSINPENSFFNKKKEDEKNKEKEPQSKKESLQEQTEELREKTDKCIDALEEKMAEISKMAEKLEDIERELLSSISESLEETKWNNLPEGKKERVEEILGNDFLLKKEKGGISRKIKKQKIIEGVKGFFSNAKEKMTETKEDFNEKANIQTKEIKEAAKEIKEESSEGDLKEIIKKKEEITEDLEKLQRGKLGLISALDKLQFHLDWKAREKAYKEQKED